MPGFARTWTRCRRNLPLAILALALAPAAMAQVKPPIDPLVGQYERSVRALQGQATVDPGGAARAAAQLRRQFIDQNGGVHFSPERAQVDLELRQLENQRGVTLTTPPPTKALPETRLPSSYGEDPGALPSMQREIGLVGRLLDRAQDGIHDRNPEQARSDLATAAASLAGLRAALPAAEIKPLSERLDGLERQLAALPPE